MYKKLFVDIFNKQILSIYENEIFEYFDMKEHFFRYDNDMKIVFRTYVYSPFPKIAPDGIINSECLYHLINYNHKRILENV